MRAGRRAPDSSDLKAVLLLTFLVLAAALPFVHRAYFIDDYYHVTMARGLLAHPARPYDFLADDNGHHNIGWERGRAPRMVNPPAFHYFLALAMKLWGDESWKLRTAVLVFPLVSAFCVYFLGKRFTRRPLAAASLLVITPAFWLTSYSLLIDGALLACFLMALLAFIIGAEKRRLSWILFSGALMGLTFLVKYSGALIFPLCLSWQWMDARRRGWKGAYAAYAVAAAVILLWGLWGIFTYGQMHFLATFSRGFHSTSLAGLLALLLFSGGFFLNHLPQRRFHVFQAGMACWLAALLLAAGGLFFHPSVPVWMGRFYVDKWVVVASFLGGSLFFPVWSVLLLGMLSRRALLISAGALAALYGALHSSMGGFGIVQSLLLCLFIGGSAAFLGLMAHQCRPWQSAQDRFLMFWIVAGLFELVTVMPWTAGRYFLLILPPAAWVFLRLVDQLDASFLWPVIWCSTALLGFLLAVADYAQAGAAARLAQVLTNRQGQLEAVAPRPPHHWYYLGDTFDGAQPYLLALGWQNVFPDDPLQAGDLLIKPRYRQSSWWRLPQTHRLRLVLAYEARSRLPLRVMDVPSSAGFYASAWGALPFTITRDPLERFEVYQVQ